MAITFKQLIPGAGGSGTTLTSVTITGTGGQFSCAATGIATGYYVLISGTFGGTGSITGYSDPTTYLISATNTTTTFTLTDVFGNPITTTTGTPSGLTFVTGVPSGSFTPTAGDQLLGFAFNGGSNNTMSFVGLSTFSTLATGINPGTVIGLSLSCASGAQTIGLTLGGNVFGAEYSGVGSGTSPTPNFLTNPGTGSGAILGTSVNVPIGNVLIAWCVNFDAGTNTITSPSGTNRGNGFNGNAYAFTEYAGAGSNIQPSFTSADGGTNRFIVEQILLVPPVSVNVLLGQICM